MQVLAVEVHRNLAFLRVATPLTLVTSVEVIAGAAIKDEFGTNLIPAAITIYGMTVSNPNNGDFGEVPSGSAGRIVAGGFEPGEKIDITAIEGLNQETLGELTATENGTISGFFAIPFAVGGPYTMIATGESGTQRSATFSVVPAP